MSKMVWHGDRISAKVKLAVRDAVDETTADAADIARNSHWWISRTGQLRSEIGSEKSSMESGHITGKFGTSQRRGFYGLFLEHKTPFIRPAADIAFRKLQDRIRRRM